VTDWQGLITLQLRHLHLDRQIMEIFCKAHFLYYVCVCEANTANKKVTCQGGNKLVIFKEY